jgi:hypothetical protein
VSDDGLFVHLRGGDGVNFGFDYGVVCGCGFGLIPTWKR